MRKIKKKNKISKNKKQTILTTIVERLTANEYRDTKLNLERGIFRHVYRN